ncbi:hypothetical protein OSB04_030419 [Centaurea solstitialis]|uniref:Uncharacterized protein n=1 Tax=Centaurea solstitialis TaxID=347529 RepID=A0AA38SJT7_9ASTR|nr:hypothetical protein OSB04_030419 [Centaurea solstitialis]
MLQLATHVKHLRVKIECMEDFKKLILLTSSKLIQKSNLFTSVVNLDFVIPCLEEVVINVKSAFNVKSPSLFDSKKVTRMVESLMKYGIKVNTGSMDFSEEIFSSAFAISNHNLDFGGCYLGDIY